MVLGGKCGGKGVLSSSTIDCLVYSCLTSPNSRILELRGKVPGEAERDCGKRFKDENISREEGFGKKKRSWKGIHGKSPPSHQGELFG